MDFSQVKEITIPEGTVKKITDSQGNVLWMKKESGWITGTYTRSAYVTATDSTSISVFSDYELKQIIANNLGVNYANIEITSRQITVNIENRRSSGDRIYYRLGLGQAQSYLRYINRGTVPLSTTSTITFDTTDVIDDLIYLFSGTSDTDTTNYSAYYMRFTGTESITVSYRYNPNLSNMSFRINLTTNSSDIFNYTTYTSGSYSWKRIRIPTDAEMLQYIYDTYGIDSSRVKITEYKVVVGYSETGGSSQATYYPILTSTGLNGNNSVTPDYQYAYLKGDALSGGTGTRYGTVLIDKSNITPSHLYGYYYISSTSYWYNMYSNSLVQILTSGTDAQRTRIEATIAYEPS